MKKPVFALLRTFLLAALVPALSVNLVACSPDDLGGTDNDSTSVNSGVVDKNEKPSDGTIVVGEAVDLGLSVKWASCNVGAESPEDYGDYFAWGETSPKSSYTESTSITYGLSIETLKSRGIIGSDGKLTAEYDAATANWGSDWRMPTFDEMKELLNDCTWEWTTQNGVYGYNVIGNGNSIFFPAAGYRYDTSLYSAGTDGGYWSATPDGDSSYACDLSFDSDDYDWNDSCRDYGRTVRPVSDK